MSEDKDKDINIELIDFDEEILKEADRKLELLITADMMRIIMK